MHQYDYMSGKVKKFRFMGFFTGVFMGIFTDVFMGVFIGVFTGVYMSVFIGVLRTFTWVFL